MVVKIGCAGHGKEMFHGGNERDVAVWLQFAGTRTTAIDRRLRR
jgi:hypothetical protein